MTFRLHLQDGILEGMADAREIPIDELPSTDEGWRERLDPLQFEMARKGGTEEGVERLVALGGALSGPIRVRMLAMMAEGLLDEVAAELGLTPVAGWADDWRAGQPPEPGGCAPDYAA